MKNIVKNKIKRWGAIAFITIMPVLNVIAADETTTPDNIEKTIKKIINWITGIGGVLATFFIVVAGIMLITQNENAENVKKAGQIIKWAAIGLVVILMAQVLSNIVQTWVVK
ncbi:MAG: pilin [Candidatus Pacebacteria bacterium]|nr:pilin [Candidatus Paceibacterota bacterium]